MGDYADKKVIPYISRDSKNCWPTLKRVDVIWDRYLPDSLKATIRQRRGARIRQRMRRDGNGKFPRNWNSYLQNASNKVELFHYLSVAIVQTVFCEGKVVISTLDETLLGSPVPGAYESEYPLRPCNHEEFDTRVLSHAANAVSYGYKRILTIANDTDIIVLGISLFSYIGADVQTVGFTLETNCGTFQFMTSAVRCLPPSQKLFPHSLPWPDQITHPSFLARERNLLTQNGTRGQSSQPR